MQWEWNYLRLQPNISTDREYDAVEIISGKVGGRGRVEGDRAHLHALRIQSEESCEGEDLQDKVDDDGHTGVERKHTNSRHVCHST